MTTLHNGEKKTTVSSTPLLLVLVLLLCSSNTESASYGDRNQGGAIFYCANTEKGGPISFIHGKRSFFVSQWFFSGLQNAHCLLMVPKRETIV